MTKRERPSGLVLGLWSLIRISGLGLLVSSGCGSPDAANIELRKQNQALQAQVDTLSAGHQRDLATLAAERANRPTIPVLPPDRLAQLVTVHDIDIGRRTGGDNPDSVIGPDTMLTVYVVPVDDQGTAIKAAGAFTVEAFDLGSPAHPLIGTWRFPADQVRHLFYDQLALYTYVLRCPWQTVPPHPNLTVKVTFDDALTGGRFVKQTQVAVHPPPTTRRS